MLQFLRRLRGFRAHLALPAVVGAATLVLLVNELTYLQTTRTLANGIELTDARVASARCLQLLTDAETAQRGLLLTGRASDLQLFEAARGQLPQVLEPTLAYLAQVGPGNVAAAQQVRELIAKRLAEMDLAVMLVRSGRRDAAMDVVAAEAGSRGMQQIRQAFGTALARAASQQALARISIYNGLLINRIVVMALTLVGSCLLWLFIRQLRAQDTDRRLQQTALRAEVELRTRELRELAGHLQTVREDERRHLARELHDEMGGLLSAIKLDVLRLRAVRDVPAAVVDKVGNISRRVDQVIALKRRVIEDLHPSALDLLGLRSSLDTLCEEASDVLGVPVLRELEDVDVPPDARLTVYRLVQESLTNIGKYAHATQVQVRLVREDAAALAQVQDDGIGFDPAALQLGHGLAGMRYRVESQRGRMSVQSRPGGGTTISAWLPLPAASEIGSGSQAQQESD